LKDFKALIEQVQFEFGLCRAPLAVRDACGQDPNGDGDSGWAECLNNLNTVWKLARLHFRAPQIADLAIR
jgi:hypothetical protein